MSMTYTTRTIATLTLALVALTGCHPAVPDVEIGEAVTTVAPDSGMIPAIAQDAGGPVEELR